MPLPVATVEPESVCLHNQISMRYLLWVTSLLAATICLPAQTPVPTAAVGAAEVSQTSPEADPARLAPKMRQEINLADTANTESLEIPPPENAPPPEQAEKIKGLLAGEKELSPSLPVSGKIGVSAEDNGKTIHAKVGNLLRIALKSSPSTGYSWELSHFEYGAAHFYSSELIAQDEGNPLFGAPSATIITLQAVQPGRQTIKLVYRRPWEPPNQVQKTFTFQLEVASTKTLPSVPLP